MDMLRFNHIANINMKSSIQKSSKCNQREKGSGAGSRFVSHVQVMLDYFQPRSHWPIWVNASSPRAVGTPVLSRLYAGHY